MNYYQPLQCVWPTRPQAAAHCHYFQKVNCIDLTSTTPFNQPTHPGALLLGFASDEGVKRNHGRLGSHQGPLAIRRALAPLVCSLQSFTLLDGGDIQLMDTDLATAQQILAQQVAMGLQQKLLSIVLGGGHELAWGHYQGIRQALPTSRLGIINFDAHFDLRQPASAQQATSGTSFWQIAQDCQHQQLPWHYYCLGIQPASNSPELFDRAAQLNVRYCTARQLISSTSTAYQLLQFMANTEHIYLSICLDVFAQAFAPGVSAPQPLGIEPRHILPLLTLIFNSRKVIAYDIAELSPPWDIDERTAKLAAYLIDYCLHQFASNTPH